MKGMRKPEYVADPEAWFEHAQSLLLAATALWKGGMGQMNPRLDTEHRVLTLGVARGWMTLIGAALECGIKGLADARGLIRESNGKIVFDSVSGAESHSLYEMATSLGIHLSASEESLLKRASEYLSWAGRYPVSKRPSRTASARGSGLLTLHIMDQITAKELIQRIKKQTTDEQTT